MRILFLYLVLSFCNSLLFAITFPEDNTMEIFSQEFFNIAIDDNWEREGDLNDLEPKSLKPSVALTREEYNLKVIFEFISEEIDIYIYDETGKIKYWDNIGTNDHNSIDIDTSSWEKGNYTIEIINLENDKLTGRFRL